MPLTALPGQSLNPSSVLNLHLHLQVPLHLARSFRIDISHPEYAAGGIDTIFSAFPCNA